MEGFDRGGIIATWQPDPSGDLFEFLNEFPTQDTRVAGLKHTSRYGEPHRALTSHF
jgi:hypothetical protein